MSRKITGAQKPFKMLVANLRQGSDPSKGSSGNPVKVRSSYQNQFFPELGGRGFQEQPRSHKTPGTATRQGLLTYTVPSTPVAPTFSVEFDAAIVKPTQIGNTRIIIGDATIIPEMDFTVVAADPNTTATNFGVFIASAFGWAGVTAGPKITVQLPSGLDYNNMLLSVTGPDSGFYIVEPVLGYPISGEPYIGPANIG